jgi:hypothetical protein
MGDEEIKGARVKKRGQERGRRCGWGIRGSRRRRGRRRKKKTRRVPMMGYTKRRTKKWNERMMMIMRKEIDKLGE